MGESGVIRSKINHRHLYLRIHHSLFRFCLRHGGKVPIPGGRFRRQAGPVPWRNELLVFEVTGKHVCLAPTDAEQPVTRRICKRVSSLDAVRGYVRALMRERAQEDPSGRRREADCKEGLGPEARLRAWQALCDYH
jgi:hypothetical protein